MEDHADILDTILLSDSEVNALLKKLSAFYSFKKKGIEVVEKVYPDMTEFVLEHRSLSYDELKAALLNKLQ